MAEEEKSNVSSFNTVNLFQIVSYATASQPPSNIVSGVFQGLNDIIFGTFQSVGALVSAPIIFGWLQYHKYGYLGAMGGGLFGTLLGGVFAVYTLFRKGYSGGKSIVMGTIRTPSAIYSGFVGKIWDSDLEEWISFDLQEEIKVILNLSEEDFLEIYERTKSFKSIFSKQVKENLSENNDKHSSKNKPKKDVADKELYNLLGVEPEASHSEIKKAYYLKARQFHPDKNPDPNSKKIFQAIGQAYQVLGDETSRAAYDSKGKDVVKESNNVDANMLYAIIFGSDNFEGLIGELQIATYVRLMNDQTQNTNEHLLQFRQRKRIIQCIVNLLTKLEPYLTDDTETFQKKAEEERTLLTENLMGQALLHTIGKCYIEFASLYISQLDYFRLNIRRPLKYLYNSSSLVYRGFQFGYDGWGLYSIKAKQDKEKEKAKEKGEETSESESAKRGAAYFYDDDATPEQKKKIEEMLKGFSYSLFNFLWEIIKFDIRETVKNIIHKMLSDHGVSDETRQKRAKGIIQLGKIYVREKFNERECIYALVDRLGPQMGLFGTNDDEIPRVDPNPNAGSKNTSSKSNKKTDNSKPNENTGPSPAQKSKKDNYLSILEKLDDMSVKELKELLEELMRENPKLFPSQLPNFVEKVDIIVFIRFYLENAIQKMP